DEYADIDRFNDVFAKIFKILVFGGLLFQRTVQESILQRDTDVIRDGLEEFDVFTRQIVAITRTTQSKVCNNPVLCAARDEVMQTLDLGFEEDWRLCPGMLQKAECRGRRSRHA